MLTRSHWASSVIDCQPYYGDKTGSVHGSDHVMDHSNLRLCVKVTRPIKLDGVKLNPWLY